MTSTFVGYFVPLYFWEFSQFLVNFRKKKIIHITNFDNPLNHRNSSQKNLVTTLLFVDFSEAFDSMLKGKMEKFYKKLLQP